MVSCHHPPCLHDSSTEIQVFCDNHSPVVRPDAECGVQPSRLAQLDGEFVNRGCPRRDVELYDTWIFNTIVGREIELLTPCPMTLFETTMPFEKVSANFFLSVDLTQLKFVSACFVFTLPVKSIRGIGSSSDLHRYFSGSAFDLAKESEVVLLQFFGADQECQCICFLDCWSQTMDVLTALCERQRLDNGVLWLV